MPEAGLAGEHAKAAAAAWLDELAHQRRAKPLTLESYNHDLAALLAQYRIAKKGMEHKVFQERFHAILSARTRLGTVEEVANAVVWLCSDQASFITGETLRIDGGMLAGFG